MVRFAVSVTIHLCHGDLPSDSILPWLSENTRWLELRISEYELGKHWGICEVTKA